MSRKAKIFSPDIIKDKICQAVKRDMQPSLHEYEGMHSSAIELMCRQAFEIDKKYVSLNRTDDSLRSVAIQKFLDVNEHMENFNLRGLGLPGFSVLRPQTRGLTRDNIMLRARAICHSILTPFDEDEWFRACKHGTGASIGVSFKDTSFEAKSTLPITATRRVTTLLRRYFDFDSQLKSAVHSFNDCTPIGEWYEEVNGSRATTVPKNSKTDRMIAVEPTGNMFFQQGLMSMMYDRLKRVGLDLETLPTDHRKRAQIASITSKEATIDWSSASDCVSYELVRWLIPPIWFECMDMCRSPVMSIDGTEVKLNMFSTMGNAVTFPLETLVFWSLAQATLIQETGTLSHFPEWKDRHRCSVFGDDCIVPSTIADKYISIMQSVGFIVNRSKSFTDDFGFRESCGGDYLRGYDVRPFYLKSPRSSRFSSLEPWLYIIANRLTLKYMLCFGERDYIYRARNFYTTLAAIFREYGLKLRFVPPDFPDDAGFKNVFDVQRLTANYRFVLSPIARGEHGIVTFLYCRFRYYDETRKNDDLRYALWLKQRAASVQVDPDRNDQIEALYKYRYEWKFIHGARKVLRLGINEKGSTSTYSRKERGGYVVARCYTAFWAVADHSFCGHKTAAFKRTIKA